MAAYAVTARIERVRPRVARWTAASQLDRAAVDPILQTEAIDLVGRPLAAIVAERWARTREAWAQTTFFLFDPDSWR
ncbi:MAG: hypothetical protein QOI52_1264 [Chloroflexota bacterium]|jgi:hypothetical protein|nr:hypothetical protein [Chloroflexota bacterium]